MTFIVCEKEQRCKQRKDILNEGFVMCLVEKDNLDCEPKEE